MADVYQLSDYSYVIDPSLVAQVPADRRSDARLLVRGPRGELSHHRFADLPRILPQGSLLVRNNSKVFPARMLGETQNGGEVEIFVLRCLEEGKGHDYCIWEALARPLKKFARGKTFKFAEHLNAECLEIKRDPSCDVVHVKFNRGHAAFMKWLEQHAKIPLPPYIHRKHAEDDAHDRNRYQTIFANEVGSVAAPTAGLHFDALIEDALVANGIEICEITLHVGAGTFLPVKTPDIRLHHMHREWFMVPEKSYYKILETKARAKPIIFVGTTTLRTLQSFHDLARRAALDPFQAQTLCNEWHETNLFIKPSAENRFKPWLADGLITNFHQPESSLLLLVCALLGREEVLEMYKAAQSERYRFFSYGDASLLWMS